MRISSASCPARAGFGPEQRECFVEERDVGVGPGHLLDRFGAGPDQSRDLVVVERSAGGEPEQRRGPEEIVEKLRGGEHRPHPLERRAHLLGGAHPLTHCPGVDGVAGARREGIEQRLLDEATRRVVLMSAASRGADDAL